MNSTEITILSTEAPKEGEGTFVEWVWVAGYSSLSTLVIIFNLILFFSVGKNPYLHYSSHYTVLALAFRNILSMLLSICLLLVTKLETTPWLVKAAKILTDQISIEIHIVLTWVVQHVAESKLMCEVLSSLDTFLSASLMFYLLGLGIYMVCRSPNPPLSQAMPVYEPGWQAPLLLLLPPLCALLLALPAPLLHMPHTMAAIPGVAVCESSLQLTYQTTVATLSCGLPGVTLILIIIGLALRRCLSCTGGNCISSFCKEEITLTMLSLPFTLLVFFHHLPLIDTHLERLGMQASGLQAYIGPAVIRGMEAAMALYLPAVLYCLLPPYRKFRAEPDDSDLYQSKRDLYRPSVSTGDRLSEASMEI